jgi:hypothetical protein
MLKNLARPAEVSVSPRAIFARPIEYFSARIDHSEDGLDTFKAACFCSGNELYFELRKYSSHPENTVTLYLSFTLEEGAIVPTIHRVVETLRLPWEAVIWFWSEEISAIRPVLTDDSRLSEAEARELVLKVASKAKNLTVSMQDLRDGVQTMYPLSKADRVRSPTRPAEQLWQQILRNVVSHRGGNRSIFVNGLAEKIGNGIRVTKAGLDHLKRSGFVS